MSHLDYKRLYNNLKHDTYCRIGVSEIKEAGVGVIAIRDIPRGTDPFKYPQRGRRKDKVIHISEDELKSLDKNVQQYVKDFFFPTSPDGKKIFFPVTCDGLNSMNISFYLNHSETPNLDLVPGKDPYYEFRTNKDIKKGEELFINYFD